jgi:hypothetical protein
MQRPTLLIAEPEPHNALSVRKLVMESAKFNVLTAHSTIEALDVFNTFPGVAAAVLTEGEAIDCERIVREIRPKAPDIPIIYLSPRIGGRCAEATHHLSSHEPQALLDLVRKLLGDPRKLDERRPQKNSMND